MTHEALKSRDDDDFLLRRRNDYFSFIACFLCIATSVLQKSFSILKKNTHYTINYVQIRSNKVQYTIYNIHIYIIQSTIYNIYTYLHYTIYNIHEYKIQYLYIYFYLNFEFRNIDIICILKSGLSFSNQQLSADGFLTSYVHH